MGRTKTLWYVADFETTNENDCSRVWLWCLMDQDKKRIASGDSIESFIKKIRGLRNALIYFHNLRFDGSFILNYLLDEAKKSKDNMQYAMSIKDVDSGFSALIDDKNIWYKLQIKFSPSNVIEIWDSLKVLLVSEKKLAQDFNMEIQKGKIDYNNYTINDETLNYCFNDCEIVVNALNEVKKLGINALTISSSAYRDFRRTISIQAFNEYFPELPLEQIGYFRDAYRGGRVQLNYLYENVILENVYRYDVNSMYPSIMVNCQLPVGKSHRIHKKGGFGFEFYHLQVELELKENHLPTLLVKGGLYMWNNTSYYTSTGGIPTEIWINSIDYELLKKHYNIIYERWIEGFGFETRQGIFNEYVETWFNVKECTTGVQRMIAKRMLNALSGKFGSVAINNNSIPDLTDGKLNLSESVALEGKHYYLPVAIAINAYAHKILDEAISAVGLDNFVYCDTDSIHSLVPLPDEFVDDERLGFFALEAIETQARYLKPKTYITKEDEGIVIKCSGMPDNLKELFIEENEGFEIQNFEPGYVLTGKLVTKQVKGGVILNETRYQIG